MLGEPGAGSRGQLMARPFNPRVWNRNLHRWIALGVALPFLVVITTGILLQLKKQLGWVQPPEQSTAARTPTVSFDQLLAAARGVPAAGVADWGDVDRIDVRPAKGVVKLTSMSRWELQIDIATGEVLQSAYRRSDLIESLHDGSWFHSKVKLWIFLPAAFGVLALWITGIYLFVLPFVARRRRREGRGPALRRALQQGP
jgi:uncharacterized iron-regulated membrane protein